MHLSTEVWMYVAGLFYLLAGLLLYQRELRAARGWNRLIVLGCTLMAASLATFGPEHFGLPSVQGAVPHYMPAPRFWTFLVGGALLAAATSLTLRVWMRWSCLLLAMMFSLFVFMIHVESMLAQPKDRFVWAVLLRDSSFAAGAWALAGLQFQRSWPAGSRKLVTCGRIAFGVFALFFSAEHFLHPHFAPGVPLQKLMPAWIPLPGLWAYVTGAILCVCGLGLVIDRYPRMAVAGLGAWMTILTLVVYFPGLLAAHGQAPGALIEPLNYVADTLLYAATALVLASALPPQAETAEQALHAAHSLQQA